MHVARETGTCARGSGRCAGSPVSDRSAVRSASSRVSEVPRRPACASCAGADRTCVHASPRGRGQPRRRGRAVRPRVVLASVSRCAQPGYAGEEMPRVSPCTPGLRCAARRSRTPCHDAPLRSGARAHRVPGLRGVCVPSVSYRCGETRMARASARVAGLRIGTLALRPAWCATNGKRAEASVTRHGCRRGKTFGGYALVRRVRIVRSVSVHSCTATPR